jgi:salicylate biosynthesis isochorismate synthase/menaquinone-specific isochorismate synthase
VWVNPAEEVWMVGLGVCAEGGGEVTFPDGFTPPAGPWFGGWAFDAERAWRDFDHERWVLPEVLAWWDGARTRWLAFGPEGTPVAALEARLDRVTEQEPVTERELTQVVGADRDQYVGLVAKALDALGGRLSKLVVAREIEVESVEPLPERAILKALEARNPACWTFLVRGRDGSAFLGASPELLCEATGATFCTDALAGTASPEQGEWLLHSEKDRREHQAVVDDLRARLDPFVTKLEVPAAPQLKRLASVVHLHTPIRATLREGVSALEVARALHPTPAVGGTPRAEAMAWLREHEGFERGWYCGAVGAVGPGRVTLAVALRSALVTAERARVFVGAGIVRGSEPAAEWLETERKAKTMLAALGVGHG